MSSSFLASFLGALQASVSVVLVIFYGVLAAQFKLLDKETGKNISKVCVRMFLPMLLITKIGAELHLGTYARYIPVLIWGLVTNIASILLGIAATKFCNLPDWVTPAIAFNNTTSLPLLLVQSLSSTGILERLVIKDETTAAVIDRAQSYFLVFSVVNTCLTFSIGPRLIDAEHAPESVENPDKTQEQEGEQQEHTSGDVEHAQHEPEQADEMTSLLPDWVLHAEQGTKRRAWAFGEKRWKKMTPRTQHFLLFLFDFLNAPLIGALTGCIIGLTPPLHRAFFNDSPEGGFLNAWLTSSLSNTGKLFVTLQVIVVGVSLSSGLRKMKRGEASGDLPVLATIFVLVIRFIIWPIISIPAIWALATKTQLLDDDPVLWFAMMLMPTGPPAMKLIAMADVNGASDAEKLSISKLLTLAYALSPLLAFIVVGALHASEAAIGKTPS